MHGKENEQQGFCPTIRKRRLDQEVMKLIHVCTVTTGLTALL